MPAPSGIPAALWPNAQNRFCFTSRIVERATCTAATTSRMSSRMRMTLPVSLATSVPEPIALPTSARAAGGAPRATFVAVNHRPLHAQPLQLPHRASGGLLERVGDGDEAQGAAVRGDEHHRLALALQPLRLRRQPGPGG